MKAKLALIVAVVIGMGSLANAAPKRQFPSQKDGTPKGGELSAGLKRDLSKLREDRRQLRDQLTEEVSEKESLKNELAEIKALLSKKDARGEEEPKGDSNAIRKELETLLAAQRQQDEIAAKWDAADRMFRKLRYTDDPSFGEEVKVVMRQRYGDIIDVNPAVALRSAYQDVCRQKGIAYEPVDDSEARASGAPGSPAPSSSGQKVDKKSVAEMRRTVDWSDPAQRAAAKKQIDKMKESLQKE